MSAAALRRPRRAARPHDDDTDPLFRVPLAPVDNSYWPFATRPARAWRHSPEQGDGWVEAHLRGAARRYVTDNGGDE